jgi:hypothetical protein
MVHRIDALFCFRSMCHFGVQLKGPCRLWKGFDVRCWVGSGSEGGEMGGGGGYAGRQFTYAEAT